MMGTPDGVLHHTQSSKTENRYWYNGVESGEHGGEHVDGPGDGSEYELFQEPVPSMRPRKVKYGMPPMVLRSGPRVRPRSAALWQATQALAA